MTSVKQLFEDLGYSNIDYLEALNRYNIRSIEYVSYVKKNIVYIGTFPSVPCENIKDTLLDYNKDYDARIYDEDEHHTMFLFDKKPEFLHLGIIKAIEKINKT